MSQLSLHNFQVHNLAPFGLEVSAGECTTLSGPSGCGKTLLLRAIVDLDPHSGEVSLNGHKQSDIPAPQWRSRVGFLPAESHWWGDHVGDHFDNADPVLLEGLGFTTAWLEREVRHLSSGERQRLSLARLLSGNPEALLLDEPTANLDKENTARVEQVISTYQERRQAAVIWVTHDLEQQRRIGNRHFNIREERLEIAAWT